MAVKKGHKLQYQYLRVQRSNLSDGIKISNPALEIYLLRYFQTKNNLVLASMYLLSVNFHSFLQFPTEKITSRVMQNYYNHSFPVTHFSTELAIALSPTYGFKHFKYINNSFTKNTVTGSVQHIAL